MRNIPALLIATALAATACSGGTDTAAEAEPAPTTEASALSTAGPVSLGAELGEGPITIETEIDWGTEPITGTFEVAGGTELLGCSSGSVVEDGGPDGITNEFTCEGGQREGTFTFQWKIIEGADGPGDVNGPWRVLDATGDFAGLTGEGLWSGTSDEVNGFGSFPGEIEFGPVDDIDTELASGDVASLLAEGLSDVWIPDDLGGVMVAIVEPDGSMVHASRTPDAGAPAIGPDDLFRVGSITKVFTSALTLSLVEDGLVNLDAPASDYVTRISVPDGVTVRHLLGHRSGIVNYTARDFFEQTGADDARVWTPEDVVAIVADEPAEFEPGADFSYSNTNYILLGTLIEEVTGETYEDALRSRIIGPAAMTDTYVAGAEDGADVAAAYSGFFTGSHEVITADYTSVATGAWSAGALVSSPADLHSFFTALFGGELINDELLGEMTTAPEGYGLGIEISPRELGEGLYGHGGSIMGFNTMVLHAPETGRTGFWVATSDSVDPHPGIVAAAPLLEAETLD
jgi:D-alanyl-D-alanine carboxypeptidase